MPHRQWPELSAERDGPTVATLHLVSQIVGKAAAALLPWRNHSWHVALHLHPRGLRTEPLHGAGGVFELGLDLADHVFTFTDAGGTRQVPLRPMTLAAFHGEVTGLLAEVRPAVRLHGAPNELDPAVPFAEDQAERAYDRDSAERLLRALLRADRVLRLFRSGFLGKASPVHFFWGSFDLAVTRFSGRRAPPHPGGVPHLPDAVTREAYSHEVSSAGFWPGGAGAGGGPFFYSYAYPPPPGFAEARVEPQQAGYDEAYGEFVLDYEVVRGAPVPDEALLAFLDTSYAAAADLGGWDRAALECKRGRPRVPREV
ncbi:MAG TPA: DUF5996 family protein [Allosphingosinicella sp.]|jgi:hypothetical protein